MPPVTRNQTRESGNTPLPKSSSGGEIKKNKPSKESKKEALKMGQIILLGTAFAIALLASVSYGFHEGKLNLAGKTQPDHLKSFGARLEFVLRYQAVGVSIILVNIFLVIAGRVKTNALNPLDGKDDRLQSEKQILQNTFEQYLLNLITQIVLAVNLSGEQAVKYIPLLNVLFLVGRVLFWLGYPKYRTAGFMITLLPTVTANLWNFYKLTQFLNLSP